MHNLKTMWRKKKLKNILCDIKDIDPSNAANRELYDCEMQRQRAYDRRNNLVIEAVVVSKKLGMQSGFMVHTPIEDIISGKWDMDWGVVAHIELPEGQIRWHLDSRGLEYDGHNDTVKWLRVQRHINL